MDLKKALELLEITTDDYKHIDSKFLQKKYHKLALIYHPDKNKSPDANLKFQELQNAYEFLLKELQFIDDITDKEPNSKFTYNESLYFLLETIFKNNTVINELVQIITTGSIDISLKVIDKLDKETIINIYSFLEKYKNTLYLSEDLIERIKQMVIKKYQNINIYKLNPTLMDLFENNIFQLKINESYVYVPLWHHEMYYDVSGHEIIVICDPDLPSEIKIDEDNNIYITKEISKNDFFGLLDEKYLEIPIYNKKLTIPTKELYLRKYQTYICKDEGISIVNDDIYEINNKSNIILQIIIH